MIAAFEEKAISWFPSLKKLQAKYWQGKNSSGKDLGRKKRRREDLAGKTDCEKTDGQNTNVEKI